MKIFLDFDDVLFHTQAFVNQTQKIFVQCGVSEELYRETYMQSRQKGNGALKVYGLDVHLKMLQELLPGFDAERARQGVEAILADTATYVFSDVEKLLKRLYAGGAQMYVVSFGVPAFQRAKIENSGLKKYLKGVLVGLEEKGKMLSEILGESLSQEPVWFIDDQIKFIEDVKRRFPFVNTVQVCRPEGRFNCPLVSHSDFTVKNMEALGRLLMRQT
jgi:FMN phosphatase YigB (HAD superfamily)